MARDGAGQAEPPHLTVLGVKLSIILMGAVYLPKHLLLNGPTFGCMIMGYGSSAVSFLCIFIECRERKKELDRENNSETHISPFNSFILSTLQKNAHLKDPLLEISPLTYGTPALCSAASFNNMATRGVVAHVAPRAATLLELTAPQEVQYDNGSIA